MQCACAILSSMACPALQYFSTLSKKGTIFDKKLLDTKCVICFFLQLLSAIFLTLRRIQRDMIKNVYRSACEVPLCLLEFNETGIFSTDFGKIVKCIKFHENSSSGGRVVSCGQTGGQPARQIDRPDEANSRLSQFCECA